MPQQTPVPRRRTRSRRPAIAAALVGLALALALPAIAHAGSEHRVANGVVEASYEILELGLVDPDGDGPLEAVVQINGQTVVNVPGLVQVAVPGSPANLAGPPLTASQFRGLIATGTDLPDFFRFVGSSPLPPNIDLDIVGGLGNDTVDLGNAASDPSAPPSVDVDGGDGDDQIIGTGAGDTLDGGTGNNLVDGRDGDDTLTGGGRLLGGDGNDAVQILISPTVSTLVDAGAGNDTITVAPGPSPGTGALEVLAGGGHDLVDLHELIAGFVARLGPGNDRITGGAGLDRIDGGGGIDEIDGASGNDFLTGGAGKDKLAGGADSDFLGGGPGNDDLKGGGGVDYISPGPGVDTPSSPRGDRCLKPGRRTPPFWGDANGDGQVDSLDFSEWRNRHAGSFRPCR
jgi:hypothetical protein